MKIILSGGGTLGSVSPLIAVYEALKRHEVNTHALWLATKGGVEIPLIKAHDIEYREISSGKLRRYFSIKNITDIPKIIAGFFQSIKIIRKFKPEYILSAGGFVAVPVVWAAWLMRVKVLIHQQDVVPGLANRLCIPCASNITLTFQNSLKHFPAKKSKVIGNPVREELLSASRDDGYKIFDLDPTLKTVLVLGGGTGAVEINKLISTIVGNIEFKYQVLHVSGGKMTSIPQNKHYHHFEFLVDEMKFAYAVADLVITRAGLGTLTELATLQKPTIVIPMPNSHQEVNAKLFQDSNAAIYLEQATLSADRLHKEISQLLEHEKASQQLKENMRHIMPQGAAEKIVTIIYGAR